MDRPISVLLVDDHTMVREALISWLRTTGDITVVADAASADEAIRLGASLRPDVVLMDIEMPGTDSFKAAQAIMRECPGTRVVFLSGFHHDQYVELALATHAAGYVLKNELPSAVAEAIRAVAAGRTYLSPEVAARAAASFGNTSPSLGGQSLASVLTPRELEIVRYTAKGLPNREIAAAAGISSRTVQRHIENVMRKLNIHSRVELTRLAIREGLSMT